MINLQIMMFPTLEDLILSSNEDVHSIYKSIFSNGQYGYYYYTAEKPVYILKIVLTDKDYKGWIVFGKESNSVLQIEKYVFGAKWIAQVSYDSFLNEFLEKFRQKQDKTPNVLSQ